MLKILLFILLGLVGVAAAVTAYAGLTQPDSFHIERSASIAAPADKIFPLISNPKMFATWSPFDKDPNMKRVFSGPESGTGARYAWDGTRTSVPDGSSSRTQRRRRTSASICT